MTMLRTIGKELPMRQPDGSTGIYIPFGAWPYRRKDGTTVMQIFDESSAAALEREMEAERGKGSPGIPVYQGHPDVPELAYKYPDKSAIGWITAWERTKAGLRAVVDWLRDPGRGFGWHSPYWFGPRAPAVAGGANCRVNHVESIGLTNSPNIEDFRLANEAQPENKENKNMDRDNLIKLLGLAPDATDEQIAAAIQKGAEALKAADTAAKDAATKVEAAQAEAEAAKKKEEEAQQAFANERAARRDLLLDQALAAGNITPAMRPAWSKRLDEDFETGRLALANERAVKTKSALGGINPETAAAGDPATRRASLVNERMKKTGASFDDAWLAEKKLHPELF